jgi:uncharacterized protein YndB with AHSA1/START domain
MTQQPETAAKELVITRIINAPRQLVFKVWAEAEHLARWWGPKGFAMGVTKLDFRPGGIFHYSMKSPEGYVMWGRFDYVEIVVPEKIVFTSSFSDEQGNLTRAPFSATFPQQVLNKLILMEEAGKTTLVLTGSPLNATDEEWKMFEGMHASMQQGFGGTFDQLDAYLAEITQ